MQAVNLLPRQLVVEPGRSLQPLAVAAAAAVPVIAIVLVVIGYSSASSTVTAEKAKFASLQAQIAALGGATSSATNTQAASASAAQWSALISERGARRAELNDVLTKELPWDSMLRNVARILPTDVWLTQLGLQSPVTFGAAPATSGATPASNVTIAGYGESETSIALLLMRLRLLPTLSGVNLGTTTSTKIGTKTVVQFSVTASIVVPPGAVARPAAPPVAATTTTTPGA